MANELTTETIKSMATLADAFYASGLFPDIRSAAQAIVKIQAGQELNFPPIYSMAKIFIVKGRVMVAAEALGAMVKRSGRYDYKVVKLTDTECELQFTDNGKDVYLSRFTMEDAKRADLVQPGGGWFKWPRAMLVSKAVSQGARIVCPNEISGVYTPEDFGYATNPETQIVEGIVETPAPKVTVEKPVETIQNAPPQASVTQGAAPGEKQAVATVPPADLLAKMKKVKYGEATAIAYCRNVLKAVIPSGDNWATAWDKLTNDQKIAFVKKIDDLVEVS